jgi:hypothetical protein
MGYMVRRPDSAFQLSTGKKKRPRAHDKDHLDFIRGLPCLCCGKRPVEAAHVRYADWRYGKREVGGAEKPDDKWTVPLCPEDHRAQHDRGDERTWWAEKGIDPLLIATLLFDATGDDERAEAIIRNARSDRRER